MSASNAEQAVAFAALILADESIAITPEKLQTLLKAAGVSDIEPIWTTLFANALKDKDVKDILTTVTTTPVVRGPAKNSQGDGNSDGKLVDDEIDIVGSDEDSDDDDAFCSLFS